MSTTPKRHLALRVSEADLSRIDKLAASHGLTRTAYLIRAGVGELEDPADVQALIDSLGRRIKRLEEFAFGG